jgi:4-diphosphocytidyl-2-C-methyl-D-erythritol kinase
VVIFPNCKINLGLYVIRKRKDGFHDLETIFYPVALCDALEIIHIPDIEEETTITVTGLAIDNDPAENICLKAYYLLQKDFDLPVVKIHCCC